VTGGLLLGDGGGVRKGSEGDECGERVHSGGCFSEGSLSESVVGWVGLKGCG
jgi:hypothetical protein